MGELKSKQEYDRMCLGLNHLNKTNDGGCYAHLTSTKPSVANGEFCEQLEEQLGRGRWVDPLCARIFPEIVGGRNCPCFTYTTAEVIALAQDAIDRWEAL